MPEPLGTSDVTIEITPRTYIDGGGERKLSHPRRRLVTDDGYYQTRFVINSNHPNGTRSVYKGGLDVYFEVQQPNKTGRPVIFSGISVEEAEALILMLEAAIQDANTQL